MNIKDILIDVVRILVIISVVISIVVWLGIGILPFLYPYNDAVTTAVANALNIEVAPFFLVGALQLSTCALFIVWGGVVFLLFVVSIQVSMYMNKDVEKSFRVRLFRLFRLVEPLIAMLKNSEWYMRQEAAEALGQIGDARAVEPLIGMLKDWYVRKEAVKALDKIGWKPQADTLGATYWIAKGEWNRCIEIGAPAMEPLIITLKDSNESVYTISEALIAAGKILEQVPESNSNIAEIIKSLANRIRHLYNRTLTSTETVEVEIDPIRDYEDDYYGVERTRSYEVEHEQHDPDIAGIYKLISCIPEKLRESVAAQSGEAEYLFRQ